ncbi:MAG: peptidoglycan bridge formation glycyltransferase FemA/FemB family protein [Candidatus Moranbacteria bacterium]|nr:peptidoglycan bridge formation glycyltransferase FemA/FemB family protein [Candidatus Moranbacteria bacterium]
MLEKSTQFIQNNSPDGGFLQSDEWKDFQESTGKKSFHVSLDCFWANAFLHELPLVGKYLYVPRGPVLNVSFGSCCECGQKGILELLRIAKKENCGWIRIDIASEKELRFLKKIKGLKIKKAPHDVQPKQIFVIDIDGSEEEILSEMKPKTRYNIRLAQKKGVEIESVDRNSDKLEEFLSEFLRLTDVMAKRSGITTHSKEYYKKMLKNISENNLRLYTGKFEGKIISAALISFYGNTATYLHGGSDDEARNVMAPFLLHWQAILDAKEKGYKRYDFGGVKTSVDESGKVKIQKSPWEGISRFKLGFSKNKKPLNFSGSYDIVVGSHKYGLYRFLQRTKELFVFLELVQNLRILLRK